MKRVEIIANRSVEEDLMEAFFSVGIVKEYTKIPVVHGSGHSGPKMGDAVWPEENFVLLVYCDEAEAVRIEETVAEIKTKFENEGIKVFTM
ncbi:MAG: PG0541 family transporter-associated protein [Spirochaetota bacterium]